jgi:two-component sensor histidine kinase
VAIAGASRDITERKQAEELQRLLLNELNHRIKNT